MKHLLSVCFVLVAFVAMSQTRPEPPASLRTVFGSPEPVSLPRAALPAATTPAQTPLPDWARYPYLPDTNKRVALDSICCCWGYRKNTKFLFMFDTHQSFFAGQWTRMTGFKLGLQMYDKYRFGLGIYDMGSPVSLNTLIDNPGALDRQLHVRYTNLFFEYVAYRDYKWEFSFPIGLGSANVRVDTLGPELNQWRPERFDTAGVLTVAAAGHYKVFPWVGVGLGVGVRQFITPRQQVRAALNGPFYAVKLKIFIGHFVNLIFSPRKVMVQKAEWEAQKAERKQRREARREARAKPPDDSP